MSLDLRVIIEFQNGNKEVFEDIYDACYNRVFYNVLKIVNDEPMAHDITHDVFIIVYNKLNQLQVPKAFYGWLDRITKNCTIRELSKSSRPKEITYQDHDTDQIADCTLKPDEIYNAQEILAIIMQEFDNLPDGQNEVAKLRFLEDLSIQEISERLHIPEGTVKSRINTIRKILIAKLSSRNISPQTLYSVVPLLAIKATKEMLTSQQVNPEMVVTPASAALTTRIKAIPKLLNPSRLPVRTIITTAVITPIVYTALRSSIPFHTVSILSIEPSSVPTNETVAVTITLNNPDHISNAYAINQDTQAVYPVIIDESAIVTVDDNGNYSLIIESDNRKTISKDFTVNTIDRTPPAIINVSLIDHQLIVQITNDDIKTLQYTALQIDDLTINASELDDNTLVFDVPDTVFTGTLFITDQASNVTQTEITFTKPQS